VKVFVDVAFNKASASSADFEAGKPVRRPVVRLALACAVGLLCVAATAVTARATTAPGVLNHVRVIITNNKIIVPKDQFVKADGITRYPRGAVIEFVFTNKGSKPASIILTVDSKVNFPGLQKVAKIGPPIKPGQVRHFAVNFFFRGNFDLKSIIRGKVAVVHPIIIF
jgi:hypothetical protein